MNLLKDIKAGLERDKKRREDVEFLQQRINDIEAEHDEAMNKQKIQAIKDIGFWKMKCEELEKENESWSDSAIALQSKIDMHDGLKANERFLGLVRAVKYIAEFDFPMTEHEFNKAIGRY